MFYCMFYFTRDRSLTRVTRHLVLQDYKYGVCVLVLCDVRYLFTGDGQVEMT